MTELLYTDKNQNISCTVLFTFVVFIIVSLTYSLMWGVYMHSEHRVNEITRVHLSAGAEHMTMISIVAGSIGILGVTVLLVSATKAIMTYYERLRLQ